ncbi:MAG: Ferredoxin-dependent glutamate synthase 1 [Actinomycetota bacterium]|jgi:glutamate synthase (NADPH/NADH) large chain
MTKSPFERFANWPSSGLYQRASEKDACGLALVATLRGTPGHDIIQTALGALRNLEHRGAIGSDAGTGDGAGILIQIPDGYFRQTVGHDLPAFGSYGTGLVFEATEPEIRNLEREKFAELALAEELEVLFWRDVPVNPDVIGNLARDAMPFIGQVFVRSTAGLTGIDFERKLYRLRRTSEKTLGIYHPSLSSKTIVYKGMVTTLQLEPFFPELSDPRMASTLALVHSRFSTNTFPSWPLAHPYRMIAHNGEINTIRGNRNWMKAREAQLESDVLGDIESLKPIITKGASDSASFDEVLELLYLAGRSLPHAMMMMIPEAWESQQFIDPVRRSFYEYHSLMMEPWDGPAAVIFTDGDLVGATLDRNGLRPGRYLVTEDGLVVLASEAGVVDIEPAKVVRKGKLQPGKMFLVDTVQGRIIEDEEIKSQVASSEPWDSWLSDNRINLRDLPEREHIAHTSASVNRRQRTFGFTEEELRVLLLPMAKNGAEPLGAMGSDTPIAAISDRPRLLFDYFVQQFAQVTNPPLDSIREQVVTSLSTGIGPERNLLSAGPNHAQQVIIDFPALSNDDMAKIKHIDEMPGGGEAFVVRGLYRLSEGSEGLENRLLEIFSEVDKAIDDGITYLVLSDRDSNRELAPIPTLLLTSAVHHHLIRTGRRTMVGLVVEAGDVREVHHVAALVGYGAAAVNPYLALESVELMLREGRIEGLSLEQASNNLITALGKGVLKIMSKMGISAVSSYSGAQCFEVIGLNKDVVEKYFFGTTSQLGGIGIDVLHEEIKARHESAYPVERAVNVHRSLDVGGEYQWRREGPPHLFNPETVFKLQHATREKRFDIFRQYTKLIDDQSSRLMTLRGLFKFKEGIRAPISIDEVESVSEIVKRFSTGAMSYGSISKEAHETLAVAMNSIGAKSNTGEGGEDTERLLDPSRRSAIKQVASGRFGVTSMYLTNADDLQIKMAQGAKPGEGGQLAANKIYPWIAKTRHSTPGVGLISPPPHHDIYSIEDLKQLIFDLKRSNPSARVHVKLVSQVGIGTVAAGVVKAKADVVLVSGHDGGTGASPLNSLKHAGTPWELGLAETQQTLMLNGLRDRVSVQVDGQMKTGRDVVIAALLGAEEFGFATAPLVVSGCILMRVCHLDTCPVGVATQNPVLRERFTGKPEFVVNFFEFLAEEIREILASLGFRSIEEAVGHTEYLDVDSAINHWKADGLDLAPILQGSGLEDSAPRSKKTNQDHELERHFDHRLLAKANAALHDSIPVLIEEPIRNTEQAAGTLLGHYVTKAHGEAGLPEATIHVRLRGTAGQSFGAFIPSGIKLELIGDANDHVGKGLSGGVIVVRPDENASFPSNENVIAGNVVGYGATSGGLYLSGIVGERFMVRNSGATAVVEGAGDHALEYMTGGRVVILGPVGRNLGAGMSGGYAFVYKLNDRNVNPEALATDELRLLKPDAGQAIELRELVSRHVLETNSRIGGMILENFESELSNFTLVMPSDYASVVQILNESTESGLDPDGPEVWEKILEATNG